MPSLITNFPQHVQNAFKPFEKKIDEYITDSSKTNINELISLSDEILDDIPLTYFEYSRFLIILLMPRLLKFRPDLNQAETRKWLESLYKKSLASSNKEIVAYAVVSVLKYITNNGFHSDKQYHLLGKLKWAKQISNKLVTASDLSESLKNRCLVSVGQLFIESDLNENSGFVFGVNILLKLKQNENLEKDLLAYANYYLAEALYSFYQDKNAAALLFEAALESGELEVEEQANCLVHIAYATEDLEVAEELYKRAIALPGISNSMRAQICLDAGKLCAKTLADAEPSFVKMRKAVIYLKCALWFDQSTPTVLVALEGLAGLVGESCYPTYQPQLFEKIAKHYFIFEEKLTDKGNNDKNNACAALIYHLLAEMHELYKQYEVALDYFKKSLKRNEKLEDEEMRRLKLRTHAKVAEILSLIDQSQVSLFEEAIFHVKAALSCCKTDEEKIKPLAVLRETLAKQKQQSAKVTAKAESIGESYDVEVERRLQKMVYEKTSAMGWAVYFEEQNNWCAILSCHNFEYADELRAYFEECGIEAKVTFEECFWALNIVNFAKKLDDKVPLVQPRAIKYINLLDIKAALRNLMTKISHEENPIWVVRKKEDLMVCTYQTTKPEIVNALQEWLQQIKLDCNILNVRTRQTKFGLSKKGMHSVEFSFDEQYAYLLIAEAKDFSPQITDMPVLTKKNSQY